MKQETRNSSAARKILFAAFALAATACLSLAPAASALPGAAARTSTQTAQATTVEFVATQGDKRTNIKIEVERGQVVKMTATDADGTRNVPRLRPDARLTLPCAETEKKCEAIKVLNGPTLKVCVCNTSQTALLLPAVQKVREIASGGGGGGGGISCTVANPCCWEDQKLQMSVCYPL